MTTQEAGTAMAGPTENQLLEALKYGGIDKQNLAELVKIAGRFHTNGARIVKVFPLGIPVPDGVVIHTIADISALERLIKLLPEMPRIQGLEIFPKGIPKPDVFLTQIQVR